MKRILVIDVGGTHVKVGTAERRALLKIPSGQTMTAARMAAEVREAVAGWPYDAGSIGYPGSIKRGEPASEPHNLGGGWVRFDYQEAFGVPVKLSTTPRCRRSARMPADACCSSDSAPGSGPR
jgi:polyphosphate glucokinase